MTIQASRRGIIAVSASYEQEALTVLSKLNTAFEGFRARNSAELAEIRSNMAEIAAKSASRAIGAGFEPQDTDRREVNAALRDYIRSGDTAGINAMLSANAEMSVGSDPDGGYTVYPTISSQMNRRIFEISPMRRLARVVQVSSDAFEELNDLDEAEASWVGEKQQRPTTGTPGFGVLTIPVHEVYAMPKVTQKLLDDSDIDLAEWLVDKCSQRFARKEGSAFIHGDGMQKPRGLLSYPTAATTDADRPWGTLEHFNAGASGAFPAGTAATDALIDLVYKLKVDFRANANWLMNRKTAGTVRKLKDGDGNYVWQASAAQGQPDRLLGFPVELDEEMPDIASNLLSIAFGDFREAYTIVDRHGLRLLRDPFTAKPHVLFYTYKRVGGALSNSEAVKLLCFGT